jgi:hypothetical protein
MTFRQRYSTYPDILRVVLVNNDRKGPSGNIGYFHHGFGDAFTMIAFFFSLLWWVN